MKFLLLITFLFNFSCSSYVKIHTKNAPSWVNHLRDGTQTNKVLAGNKYLYRAIFRDTSKVGANKSCSEALDLAKGYIKSEYSFLDSFPYLVEYLYYDPEAKDCSATISIEKNISSKLAEINVMRQKYIKDKKDIDSKLLHEKNVNKKLQQDVISLKTFLRKNEYLFSSINKLQSKVAIISNRVKKDEDIARTKSISGATLREMESLFKKQIHLESNYSNKCYYQWKSRSISRHGKTLLCWSGSEYDNKKNILLGYCDEKSCWTRSP